MGGRPAVPAEPATAPMLSLQQSAMDRLNHELSVQRDRFIRLQSVQTDLALDLPPSIPLPDGEEIPYGSSTRLKIRDPQQESEIYQKCIRPPPNRTISDGDSSPPSRHLLSLVQNQPKKSDLFGRTVRCFGIRRNEEPASPPPPPPPPPCVHVPIMHCSRSRKLAAFSENAGTSLASVPAVTCNVPPHLIAANRPRPVIPEAYPGDMMRSHSSGTTTGGPSGAAAAAAMGSATASGSAAAIMGSATASGSAAAIGSATASGSAAAMGSATASGSAAATGSATASGSAAAPGSAGASGIAIAPRSAAIIGPPPAFGSASVISSAAAFDSVAASGFTGAFGSLGATGSASASGSAAAAAAADDASGSAEEEDDSAAKGSGSKSGKSSV